MSESVSTPGRGAPPTWELPVQVPHRYVLIWDPPLFGLALHGIEVYKSGFAFTLQHVGHPPTWLAVNLGPRAVGNLSLRFRTAGSESAEGLEFRVGASGQGWFWVEVPVWPANLQLHWALPERGYSDQSVQIDVGAFREAAARSIELK